MAVSITHAKVSSVADTADTSLVRPSDWNAEHVVTIAESFMVACAPETIPFSSGTAVLTFRMPYAFTLTGIRGSLATAQTSGSIITVDVNESGVSILSTKLTLDNGAKTSVTAATPVVISDASLAADAEITIDIDQIGDSTAKGLKLTFIGSQT